MAYPVCITSTLKINCMTQTKFLSSKFFILHFKLCMSWILVLFISLVSHLLYLLCVLSLWHCRSFFYFIQTRTSNMFNISWYKCTVHIQFVIPLLFIGSSRLLYTILTFQYNIDRAKICTPTPTANVWLNTTELQTMTLYFRKDFSFYIAWKLCIYLQYSKLHTSYFTVRLV